MTIRKIPLFLIFGSLHAEIVINEISATQSDRTLRWDANEQPFIGAAPAWWSPNFNDDVWESGNLPIGYSSGSISTNLGTQLRDISPSFYVRKNFNASAASAGSSQQLQLEIEYNDGFIAWLNGVEVARENMGATKAHIYHDQLSYRASTQSTTTRTIDLGVSSNLLQDGENTLAIQINNYTINTSMRLDLALENNVAQLISMGSQVDYLPGLLEPSSDIFEPALLDQASAEKETSDWIELHNTSPNAVDLSNWSLTDDAQLISKWIFPAGTSIQGNGHLLILADNPDAPIPGAVYLHANFKLGANGDFVGLFNAAGEEVSVISPSYPKQFPQFSYGNDGAGNFVFFEVPSPGALNSGPTFEAKVDAPDFDNKGGFYDNALTVTLSSMTAGAAIRYTTDGSEPTLSNGIDYTTPLNLVQVTTRKGHVIRARAYAAGLTPSNVKTHTFLIGQDTRLKTSPSLIYAGEPERSLYDPFGVMAINGGAYSNKQWSPTGIADYNNVLNRGRAYERPIHAEFYFADGTVGFRSEVGLRVASSSYSRPRMTLNQSAASPWPANPVEKPSFNLYFRDDYGNGSVNLPLNGIARGVSDYQRFRIRAGKNDIQNPFIVDELIRRLSDRMGNGASLGVINSLYVNGELKGFYNMVERLREPLFQSLHSQDQDAEWDVLQFEGNDNIAEGDKIAWNDMISRLNSSITAENWERVLEVADVSNMADYYLLNIFGATWDWPHNNWVAAKERSTEGRYRLYVWDAEGAFGLYNNRLASAEVINTYILGTSAGQGGQSGTEGELRDLWKGLNRWEEFQITFADRIHKHLFNNGVLDDRDYQTSTLKSELDVLTDEFDDLLSVVGNQTIQTNRMTSWSNQTNGRRSYLLGPNREDFRDHDLWPTALPPEFSKLGGNLALGETLKITNISGDIYYTTDGSDPRLFGGQANPSATSQAGSLLDVSLIPIESEWKYNDTDGDQGVAWRSPSYNDETWPSGAGPLGYGSVRDNEPDPSLTIPIATTINTPFAVRQPTTYFRKTFDVQNVETVIALNAKIRSDAGTVVYLNGVEVFYDTNIPANASYDTVPTSDASDGNEGDLDEYTFDTNLLVEGENILAVQLHNSVGSSDMVFDLQLDATATNPNNPPLVIDGPTTVMARSLDNGVWSALTAANFTVNTVPADSSNLAVVEMLYNPTGPSVNEMNAGFNDGDLFEFLRVQNIGSSSVSLEDVRFVEGLGFDFTNSQIKVIPPNGIAIIVSNLDAFRERYGTVYDQFIAGEYTGRLNNGGEPLRILGVNDDIIHEFEFEVATPWPDLTALDGHSIQINDSAGSHDDGSNWRASGNIGGVPDGKVTFALWQQSLFTEAERNNPAISGMEADPDGDGSNNLLEFALGSSPTDALSVPVGVTGSVETIGNDHHFILSYTRTAGVRAVNFLSELSDDLESWSGGGIPTGTETFNPDGTITAKLRHPTPITEGMDKKRFMRLVVTPAE